MFKVKNLFLLLTIVFLISCTKSEEELVPSSANPFMIAEDEHTMIVAHRGGKNLFPENTMVAFNGAVNMGVDALEIDVHLTHDDILVTCHDETINRTSDTTGLIRSYTFEELQQFNFGHQFKAKDGSYPYRNDPVRIPQIEEVFSSHPNIRMIIEIKNTGGLGKQAITLLYNLVEEYNMEEKVSFFSFDPTVMAHFDQINANDFYDGGSITDVVQFVLAVAQDKNPPRSSLADVFSIPLSLEGIELKTDSKKLIDAAHKNDIAMHYWTVNDKEDMKKLIELRVDGIITDSPDLMIEALKEMGY